MSEGRVEGKIIAAINKAKERVLIASPLIDRQYVDLLIKKAMEGVKVQAITSDRENNEGKSLASIAERYRDEELKRAEGEVAALEAMWKSAYLKNMAVVASAIALILAGIAVNSLLILAAMGILAVYGYYTITSSSSLPRIMRALSEAKEKAKAVSDSVMADREKLRANLSAVTAPMISTELYIVDGRAWAWSSSRGEVIEVDVEKAEEKFMDLWAKLSP